MDSTIVERYRPALQPGAGKRSAIEPPPGTPPPSSPPWLSALGGSHGRPARGRGWKVSRERRPWSAQCGCPVASPLANLTARTYQRLRPGETAGERASNRNFDFARGYGQWHAQFGPDSQAFADCIGDIRLSRGLGFPLADAARYRRALADVHAVFVPIDADHEFHAALHIRP